MLARFGQLLRAIADGPDPASVPPPAEVIATVEIGAGPADWQFPKGVYHYSGQMFRAALGVNYNITGLVNLAGSGVCAVIYSIQAYAAEDALLMYKSDPATHSWTAGGPERGLDFRLDMPAGFTRRATCKTYNQQHTSHVGEQLGEIYASNFNVGVNTRSFREEKFQVVLWPGQCFSLQSTDVNKDLSVNFYWYERFYDPEELRGVVAGIIL